MKVIDAFIAKKKIPIMFFELLSEYFFSKRLLLIKKAYTFSHQ